MPLEDFPRHPLLFGPSPVHPLDRLSDHLGGARIWAKREDCNSGLAYGGNKTRKLEYLVPDALAQGADTLVDRRDPVQPHPAGRRCRRAPRPEGTAGPGELGGLARLSQRPCRQHLVVTDHGRPGRAGGVRLRDRVQGELGERARGRAALRRYPVRIPAGASDHRLGGLGFANWAMEVQQQEEQLGVFFDTIIVCSVTGSTHAGMIAGFAGQDRPRRVLGIDASARLAETTAQVEKIARATAELIGLGRDLRDDEITVLEGWAGDSYGIPVQSTLDAIRLTGRLEGMIIDTVYEGKSMAALIDLVRGGQIDKNSTVLYAHLGGQPALNAYSALFRSSAPTP